MPSIAPKEFLGGMILSTIDPHLQKYVTYELGATVDLSLIPPRTKNQLLLNLRRGYCSSVSGSAYTLYRTLAYAFEFPLFSIGRTDRMIITIPMRADKEKIFGNLRAIWLLTLPEARMDKSYWHNSFYANPGKIQCNLWREFWIPRNKAMDLGALCGALEVDSLWDIIPKTQTDLATSALLLGSKVILKDK